MSLQLFDTLLQKDDEHIVHNLVLCNLEKREYYSPPVKTKKGLDKGTVEGQKDTGESDKKDARDTTEKVRVKCDDSTMESDKTSEHLQELQCQNKTESENGVKTEDKVTSEDNEAVTGEANDVREQCRSVEDGGAAVDDSSEGNSGKQSACDSTHGMGVDRINRERSEGTQMI